MGEIAWLVALVFAAIAMTLAAERDLHAAVSRLAAALMVGALLAIFAQNVYHRLDTICEAVQCEAPADSEGEDDG